MNTKINLIVFSGLIFAGTNSVGKFQSLQPTLPLACTPIAYDQKIDGTIAIPGEEDCFTFTGTAGHRVNVFLDHRASIFDAFSLRLNAPNGDSLAFCNFTNGDCEIDNLTLPATGVYTIVVDGLGASVGNYTVALNRLDSPIEPITYDQALARDLSPVGDQDRFTFTGTAGHRVNVFLDHRASIFDAFSLRLNTPAGDSLAFCNFTNGDCEIDNLTLPATGVYTIIVDGRGASVGNYTVALSCHTSPCGVTGNLGDVNNDGNCNSTDALIIRSFDVGLPIPQDFLDRINAGLGDVNADNLTNSTDALIILAFDAGQQVLFPVCQPFSP